MDENGVPFEFSRHQIVVAVKLNGQGPFNLLLDSGTDPSVVDRDLAKRLGLRTLPLIKLTRIATVQVGATVGRKVLALALDVSPLSERLGEPVHGVLGYSFLKSLVVRIDYPARRVWLSDIGEESPSADPHLRAPLVLWDNFPVLEGCLVNGRSVRLTLDTGSSAGLTLFPEAVAFLDLADAARAGKTGTSVGYRGEEQGTVGHVDLLELGTIRLADVETYFVAGGKRAKTPLATRAGNVGNAVLKDFVLTLDYLGETISLELPRR